MKTISIDGSRYHSRQEVHEALRRLLDLPDYYGMNADALNDCLGEMREKPRFWVMNPGEGEAAEAIALCCRVAEDNGCEVVRC